MSPLVIAAAAATILPPLTMTVPVAPPSIAPMIITTRIPAKTISFAITLRHEGTRLWEGRLVMATGGNASVTQRLEQSMACTSGAGQETVARFSTGFSINMYGPYMSNNGTVVRLTARLDRPTATGPLSSLCEDQGVRSVELQSSFTPVSGKAVTFEGDAGFAIMLTPKIEGE